MSTAQQPAGGSGACAAITGGCGLLDWVDRVMRTTTLRCDGLSAGVAIEREAAEKRHDSCDAACRPGGEDTLSTSEAEPSRPVLITSMQTLPELLTEAMAAADNMSQSKLARLSSVSRSEVNKARKGEIIPSEKITMAWDKLLGTGNALTTRAALDRAERGRTNSGPGRPYVVVPHQVATPPVRLFGRHRASTRISSDLIADELPVVVIAGSVGMGSSSLAATVAAQVQACYPDGQLYADGHGHTPGRGPATTEEILTKWLGALGVRAIPEHPSDQIELYLRLLRKRRVLLLVDDAASSAQIEALIPGNSRSTVLVTTRHRLSALAVTSGTRPHILVGLAAQDAWDMLASRIDMQRNTLEERSWLDRVLSICAGTPLAIAAAGELINSRGLRRATHLLERQPLAALDAAVHDAPGRSLSAGYRASWNCLSESARELLVALAARSPFHSPVEDHETATGDARDELIREHLLSENRELSPLLRAWVCHHAPEEDHSTDVA